MSARVVILGGGTGGTLAANRLRKTLPGAEASVDMFGITKDDFVDQIQDIITVGEFYEQAADDHIIFT